MAFDLSTAKPVQGGFDLSTAKPVEQFDSSVDIPQEAPQQWPPALPDMSASMRQATAQKLSQGAQQVAQDVAIGIPSAVPTIARGAVAEPVAGLAGLGAEAGQALGFENRGGAQAVEDVRATITGQPINPQGAQVLQSLGQAVAPIAQIPRKAGEFTQDVTGSPLAATAVETGLTAVPELLGARAAFRRPATREVTTPEADLVRQGREASQTTGIDLFEGQQTLSPPALKRQALMQQLPAGVRRASEALETQNRQASQAVDDLLARIAPPEALEQGPTRFRTAAQRAVEARRQIREERTSPIYEESFRAARQNNLNINVDDIRERFGDISEDFPETGQVRQHINRALGFLDSGDLRRLHNAKLEIDQMIEGRGDNAVGRTSRRQLTQIQRDLVGRLREASPTYEAARAEFERLSPNITQLEESIVGRVAELDDAQLKNISTRIFDPRETNPAIVRNAREVIQAVDPDAWDMLMRAEIERRMGSIKPAVGGSIENIPGQLQRAIFGNQQQTNALLVGADPETRRALTSLNTALNRAKLGRAEGSPTAVNKEILNELKGGTVGWLRNMFRQPLDTIVRTGEDSMFDRRVEALTEALFDPRYRAETTQLINSGRDRDLTRLILSIEALKASATQETQEEQQQAQ